MRLQVLASNGPEVLIFIANTLGLPWFEFSAPFLLIDFGETIGARGVAAALPKPIYAVARRRGFLGLGRLEPLAVSACDRNRGKVSA